ERRGPQIDGAVAVHDEEHRADRLTRTRHDKYTSGVAEALERAPEVSDAAPRGAEVTHVLDHDAPEHVDLIICPAALQAGFLALADLVAQLGIERRPLRLRVRCEVELLGAV